jgi:hypothetical protein
MMGQVMVRYRVKPERAEENEALVRAVYAELERERPDGLRYATYRLEDGVTFVHVAATGDDNPLPRLAAFRRFVDGVAERCDEPPVTTRLEQIGAFRP